MVIQLADSSIKRPRGIMENILVKVDKFIFPVDFVILDMQEEHNVPLIRGRPFLATARTLIDVDAGKITLRVSNEEVTFTTAEQKKNVEIKMFCVADELTYYPLDTIEGWDALLDEDTLPTPPIYHRETADSYKDEEKLDVEYLMFITEGEPDTHHEGEPLTAVVEVRDPGGGKYARERAKRKSGGKKGRPKILGTHDGGTGLTVGVTRLEGRVWGRTHGDSTMNPHNSTGGVRSS